MGVGSGGGGMPRTLKARAPRISGVLPGLCAAAVIAMLLPWVHALDATSALIVLAGFRLIDQRLPQQSLADITIRYARGSAPGAEDLRDRLKALGLVDKIVSEPVGGAHRDHKQMAAFLKRALDDAFRQVSDLKVKELLDRRYDRLQSYGRFTDTKASAK